HLQSKLTEKQALLETLDGTERLERVCALLNHEIELLDLERRIHNRVRQQMEATQKEYYLREQLKAIQQELGELDGRSNEIDAYREQIAAARMPKAARERADQELRRLEKMPPMAAESVVVRNYLDWLMALPWNKTSRDRIDLAAAGRILDAEHYGLEKVKERILEF